MRQMRQMTHDLPPDPEAVVVLCDLAGQKFVSEVAL
jgi:hypothetical protein